MMSGRLAPFSTSSARCTASGAGSWRGAGSTTFTSERLPAAASTACENSLAGKSRYTPPGRPETAERMARAMPMPMSSAWSTR